MNRKKHCDFWSLPLLQPSNASIWLVFQNEATCTLTGRNRNFIMYNLHTFFFYFNIRISKYFPGQIYIQTLVIYAKP